jgi:hypothetical protein
MLADADAEFGYAALGLQLALTFQLAVAEERLAHVETLRSCRCSSSSIVQAAALNNRARLVYP